MTGQISFLVPPLHVLRIQSIQIGSITDNYSLFILLKEKEDSLDRTTICDLSNDIDLSRTEPEPDPGEAA